MIFIDFSSSGSGEIFGSKFCFLQAPDEHQKMFGFLQGRTAREYFRFPEEPKAILDDVRGVMENADQFQMDPIFKNVRAQVKHTLELSSADQKRHFHDRMIADEKRRLNIFQRWRFGGRKQRFEDTDTMAQYHVDLSGYMTAHGIMGYFHQTDGISEEEKARRKTMLDYLKEKLGNDIVNNPQNHPVFLWAMSVLFQTPDPPGPWLTLQNLLPPTKKGFLEADLQKKAFTDVESSVASLDHTVHEIEDNGGHKFLRNMRDAKNDLISKKTEYENLINLDTLRREGVDAREENRQLEGAYKTKVDAKEKAYREAKEKFEKLYTIYKKFLAGQETLFKKLSVLIKPDPTLNPDGTLKDEFGPLCHPQYKAFRALKESYELHHLDERTTAEGDNPPGSLILPDRDRDGHTQGVERKFNDLLDALVNNEFHARFSPIKKQVTGDIERLKKFEDAGRSGDEKGPVFMTEQEFLYKVIFYRRTNTLENGGVLPNGTTLSQYQIADMKPDIVHEALLNMMEARSLKLMTDANKLRMERYTKAALRSSWWTRLFGGKYPMKNLPRLDTALKRLLPRLDTALERLRILEFDALDEKGEPAKNDKGNVVKERPFAYLKLKGKMDLADLRKLVSEGYLNKRDIPRLIGHLESVLAGYERYQIREKDLVPLLNLIKNLQILRVFHLHDQFKKNAEGDPDHLDIVIAGLWKNDLKISEKVADDSQKKLFQILRGDYKGSTSYKKQADALITEAKEKYTDKETGELDFSAAKKFLQDHGIALGLLGGLGLYLAGKKLRLGTKLKKWLPKTKAEQTGKIAEAGLTRKLGYGAIQAVKKTPGALWNTAKFLPWTLPRAAIRRIVKPAMSKLGITKVASKVGNGIVSAGKIVGGKTSRYLNEFYSELKNAVTQLPDKMNIFKGGGGGHH